ncbi:MAG TPA: phage baseplate assembly protein V [Longimicrobium sp.]|nr:phage baseplate assembly protein V [Longimicrobium sp.]
MEWEQLLVRVAEGVERRFYGKYRGFVVDRDDPESLGRLKVRVPSVLGPDVVTGWAVPCVPYGGAMNQGFLMIPEVDAQLWIEFEEGDLEFPVWVGTVWAKPGGDSELPKPNGPDGAEEGSVQSPHTAKIIKTVAGHTLQFEDDDGKEVRIILADGPNENRVVLGKSSLTIVFKGNTITLDDDGIRVEDTNGNKATQNADGTTVEDKNGNKVTQSATGTVVEDANGNKVVMGAAGIQIGSDSAAEALVLGTQFKSMMASFMAQLVAHTHVGNLGAPTSPPVPPLSPLDVPISTKHKTE